MDVCLVPGVSLKENKLKQNYWLYDHAAWVKVDTVSEKNTISISTLNQVRDYKKQN